jgi:sugar phosphate isomerase/epimerase
MKFGFVSAILPDCSFEEVIDFAAENQFKCVEVCCWPKGKAERRYAGITHIDVDTLDDEKIKYIQDYTAQRGVEISSLGYYPNPLDPDLEKRAVYIEHIKKLIKASSKLGVNMVTTFIGRNCKTSVDENFEQFMLVWPEIIAMAEENKVKIAIENCPMFFSMDEWPGGNNLAASPAIWRRMFEAIPSDYFGLNYDPSHMILLQMDHVKPIYEFRDKMFHIHFKDLKIYQDRLDQVGIMAPTLEYTSPKLPGLGSVAWAPFVSALTDIRYKGHACIEVEDKAFEETLDDRKKAIILSKNYLNQFLY